MKNEELGTRPRLFVIRSNIKFAGEKLRGWLECFEELYRVRRNASALKTRVANAGFKDAI